jgi:biotin carboxyl carrier protein
MKIHVQIQGKNYTVTVGDIQARPIKAEVDGEVFEVWPQEMIVPGEVSLTSINPSPVLPQSSAVKTDIAPNTPAIQTAFVQAPIPGVIVEINVMPGDAVVYGQELCVLEAMKMKNVIRAGRDGVIKAVHTQVGEHVHQSQLLVEFKEEGDA